MNNDSLKEREERLQLARREQQADIAEEKDGKPAGPPHANEHWKALYARIREVTEGLRR